MPTLKSSVSVSLDNDLITRLRKLAIKKDLSVSHLVNKACRKEYLKGKHRKAFLDPNKM